MSRNFGASHPGAERQQQQQQQRFPKLGPTRHTGRRKHRPLQTLLFAPESKPEDPKVQEALLTLERSWEPVTARAHADHADPAIQESLTPYETPMYLRPPSWHSENRLRALDWAERAGARRRRRRQLAAEGRYNGTREDEEAGAPLARGSSRIRRRNRQQHSIRSRKSGHLAHTREHSLQQQQHLQSNENSSERLYGFEPSDNDSGNGESSSDGAGFPSQSKRRSKTSVVVRDDSGKNLCEIESLVHLDAETITQQSAPRRQGRGSKLVEKLRPTNAAAAVDHLGYPILDTQVSHATPIDDEASQWNDANMFLLASSDSVKQNDPNSTRLYRRREARHGVGGGHSKLFPSLASTSRESKSSSGTRPLHARATAVWSEGDRPATSPEPYNVDSNDPEEKPQPKKWIREAEAYERAIEEKKAAKERRYQRMRRQNIARAKHAAEEQARAEAARIAAREAALAEKKRRAEQRRLQRIRRRDFYIDHAATNVRAKASVRVGLRHLRARNAGAAIRVQAAVRGHLTRNESRRRLTLHRASLQRQRSALVTGSVRSALRHVITVHICSTQQRHEAAICIQRVRRGVCTRRTVHKNAKARQNRIASAMRLVQYIVRGTFAALKRRQLLMQRRRTHGASTLQRYWRGHAIRKQFTEVANLNRRRVCRRASAVVIQASWRGILVRRRWAELVAGHEPQVKAALGLQRVVRGSAARRQVAQMVREQAAAMVVQGAVRQKIARKTTQKLRDEMHAAEALKLERLRQAKIAAMNTAAILLQKVYRGWRLRKLAVVFGDLATAHKALLQKQADDAKKQRAATHIQRAARGRVARKRTSILTNERIYQRKLEQAAIQIQRVARGRCVRRNFNRWEEELRARRAERLAATTLQAAYRGFRVRRVADQFESLAEQIRAQRAAGLQAANLVLAAVAVHELQARSAARLVQSLAKSLIFKRKMQKQRLRRIRANQKRLLRAKLRYRIVNKIDNDAKRKRGARRMSASIGSMTVSLARLRRRARSVTHARGLEHLRNSVRSMYEAVFHCVHFMFREDDLEPPLYIDSDTGRMSQSIRYKELRHFFKNGGGEEVDEMADQLLRFCHEHIRTHETKVPDHHDCTSVTSDVGRAHGDGDVNDTSTDRVVYVTFENVCEFFERVARGEATAEGATTEETLKNISTPGAAGNAEKLAEASDMVEYMHSVVEMCEATNYDDPGLALWKADEALGEHDDNTPGHEPAEAESYSAEDVEDAAAKIFNAFVAVDGSTGVGDNSGLLRQQLIDEFEDDDIVMFMIQHLVKGLEHPEQTKAEMDRLEAEFKTQGLSQQVIAQKMETHAQELQEPLPTISKENFVTYFVRCKDRVEAMNVLQYMELRLEDHGDDDDDFTLSDDDDDVAAWLVEGL
eukprot:INCI7611.3.p1 GENE.INCI7611.3~~INCI7611.3.p1  ORF type:complete len:1384 (+),score=260.24 INCI7611.3:413-4564(+)